jgi:ssDNA thymidine ADP-ribosyltransferase DarT-like protein
VIPLAVNVYHFTHRDNFESILAHGWLECDRTCKGSALTRHGIAYSSLKQKRLNTKVERAPGGTLGDYVPFYFGPRSPMLLTYKSGNVTGKPENQDEIIYFVTTAEAVAARGYRFVFTDGHPIKEPKAFFNNLADIDEVDLDLMTKKYWNDTDSDPDRKRRRQAEFLVYQRFAWEHVDEIGVRTRQMQQWVTASLRDTPHKPLCKVHPTWYYD